MTERLCTFVQNDVFFCSLLFTSSREQTLSSSFLLEGKVKFMKLLFSLVIQDVSAGLETFQTWLGLFILLVFLANAPQPQLTVKCQSCKKYFQID